MPKPKPSPLTEALGWMGFGMLFTGTAIGLALLYTSCGR